MIDVFTAARALVEEWKAGEEEGGNHDLDVLDRLMRSLARGIEDFETVETTEYSAELISRGRHTGVIVAVDRDTTMDWAVNIREQLEQRFPEVRFAVIPGGTSLAFEWDDPEEQP